MLAHPSYGANLMLLLSCHWLLTNEDIIYGKYRQSGGGGLISFRSEVSRLFNVVFYGFTWFVEIVVVWRGDRV